MRGTESVVGPTGGKQDGDTAPSLDQDAAQLLALRALVESLDDIVFTLDTNQRHDGVYGHWLREAGLGPEAFLGRTARQILGADAALVHESANELALAGRRVTYEWNLPTRSGSRRIQTSLVPRRASSGEIDGVVGIGRDITARAEVQARQVVSDRMTSIGILAAGIAHELSNPLASVIANLELAQIDLAEFLGSAEPSELLAAVQAELRTARESANRVRQVSSDLKTYAQVDDQSVLAVDVRQVMESTLRMARNEIRYRAKLVKYFEDVPMVLATELGIAQIFLNIIVSASRAIEEGQVDRNEISVAIRNQASSVVIEIRHSGTQPPQPFEASLTTQALNENGGFSLAISHRLVASFGGTLRITREVGGGCTFCITLPELQQEPKQPSQSGPVLTGATRPGLVLVVDDDPANAAAIRGILLKEHEVIATGSGATALDLIRQRRFDVILCDLMMPNMSGMDLFGELARSDPEQAAAMVFLTGGVFTAKARKFLETTPNKCVEKPFDAAELLAIVRRVILCRGDKVNERQACLPHPPGR